MPNAFAMPAILLPSLPSPTMPSVSPSISTPAKVCQGSPACMRAFSRPMPRVSSRIRPMVSGAVGSREYCVPPIATPFAFAASMSIEALRMPDVSSSFSFGKLSNRLLGNAVRSRIAQTISKSASALAAACSEVKGWLNTVTSMRSDSFGQSATSRAMLK
ncbi:hypothetical protein ACVJDU_003201 [Bradyrhizobium diazoefficiens]